MLPKLACFAGPCPCTGTRGMWEPRQVGPAGHLCVSMLASPSACLSVTAPPPLPQLQLRFCPSSWAET